MKAISWIATLVVAIVASVVLVGCVPLHTNNVATTIAEVREVSGVTHVSKVSFGDAACEHECSDGSAVVTVTPTLTGPGLVALRDKILARIAEDKTNSTGLILTLRRGSDQIPLRASRSRYQFLERVRHEAPIRSVRIVTALPSDTIKVTSRLSVIVASKADILAGYNALNSASAADHDFSPAHTSIEARTNDYRYTIGGSIAPIPAGLATLSSVLFANPKFIGVEVGPGTPGQQGFVFVTAAAPDGVVEAYADATPIVAGYSDFRLEGSKSGNFQLLVDSSVAPTDPAFSVMAMAIATGAHLGTTVLQRQPGYNTTIGFSVTSAADAQLLNSLATSHPEFTSELGDYSVTAAAQSWSFGVPAIG